jgi:hypothetical protein
MAEGGVNDFAIIRVRALSNPINPLGCLSRPIMSEASACRSAQAAFSTFRPSQRRSCISSAEAFST